MKLQLPRSSAALCASLLLAYAATTTPSLAAAPPPDILEPGTAVPNVGTEAGGQYYTLYLRWTRDVGVGPVTARVTYLDPPLYLAWLRRSSPDADQATFEKQLSDFPRVLRFRVAYQAADRGALHAKDWKVSLKGPSGADIPSSDGRRIAPADLKTGPGGDFWEDDWDYQLPVPEGFLSSARGFTVSLAGPAGSGQATWTFGTTQGGVASADAYVAYLGAALSLACVALLGALIVTRPPRPSVA